MILTGDRSRSAVNDASSLVADTRGGSSVGQSSGLIIRRSQVQVLPAPQPFTQVKPYVVRCATVPDPATVREESAGVRARKPSRALERASSSSGNRCA
jgi:hypothetical protein